MKHFSLFFSILVLSFPYFVASQTSTTRDSSSASKQLRRPLILPDRPLIENARMAVENARITAETARLSAELEAALPPAVEMSLHALHTVLPQALAQIGPALEQVGPALGQVGPALEQMGPALEQAMEELEFELKQNLPGFMAPLPDIPPIPPIPAFAPIPPIPPIPPLPPFPDEPLCPLPCKTIPSQPLGCDFELKEYLENLTDDEQVQIRALGGLLSQDEKTALPEIKRLARQDQNWAMRAAATSLLASAKSAEALTILDEVLRQDTDHRVRLAAVRALSNRPEPEAREILKRLLLK
jgi:hypothetical protein